MVKVVKVDDTHKFLIYIKSEVGWWKGWRGSAVDRNVFTQEISATSSYQLGTFLGDDDHQQVSVCAVRGKHRALGED